MVHAVPCSSTISCDIKLVPAKHGVGKSNGNLFSTNYVGDIAGTPAKCSIVPFITQNDSRSIDGDGLGPGKCICKTTCVKPITPEGHFMARLVGQLNLDIVFLHHLATESLLVAS